MEKIDTLRLEFLSTVDDYEGGLRYELNCFVVNGKNRYKVYDGKYNKFLGDDWYLTVREAIDAAM